MATLTFDPHARSQMRKRRIKESEVVEAVGGSYSSWPGRPHPVHGETLWRRGRTSSGRNLKVLSKRSDEGYIITVADVESET